MPDLQVQEPKALPGQQALMAIQEPQVWTELLAPRDQRALEYRALQGLPVLRA